MNFQDLIDAVQQAQAINVDGSISVISYTIYDKTEEKKIHLKCCDTDEEIFMLSIYEGLNKNLTTTEDKQIVVFSLNGEISLLKLFFSHGLN